MEPVIVFDNVHYTYPADEKESLCGVSLSIEKGSFVAVLGHNGSGKSTFAKHMNGILVPDEGRVLVEGLDTSDEEHIIDVRRRVGMVFQNPDNQLVANVVEDDVAFAPENLGVEPKEIRKRVDAALRQVGMYDYRKCIVLDEPTAMLDPSGRREVVSTALKLCREQGITVVLITHHMDECIDADRLIVMSNGCVMADGKPADIFANAELLRREGLEQPETARLLQDLRASGMRLDGEPLSVEDCAELIAQVLQSERSRS